MQALVVEDDFTSRKMMTHILEKHFTCDVAVDGEEALVAFLNAHENGQPYDLICLDIMMPKMNGQDVLKKIRQIEQEKGIGGMDGAKIIMTTALDNPKNILTAFREQCEVYLVKPMDSRKILSEIQAMGLIPATE